MTTTQTRTPAYLRGRQEAIEAIHTYGGERTGQVYMKYFRAESDDYAKGFADVVWEYRAARAAHPAGRALTLAQAENAS